MKTNTYNNIRRKLREYFSNRLLTVLDNPHRQFYTGVTFPYILKYVLKGKHDEKDVAAIMMKMLIQNKLKTLYCPTIKRVVFENANPGTSHYSFDIIENKIERTYVRNLHDVSTSVRAIKILTLLEKSYTNKFQS